MYLVDVPEVVAGVVQFQDSSTQLGCHLLDGVWRIFLRVALLLDNFLLTDAEAAINFAELPPVSVTVWVRAVELLRLNCEGLRHLRRKSRLRRVLGDFPGRSGSVASLGFGRLELPKVLAED